MPSDVDDQFIESLLNRSTGLFRKHGCPEPEKIVIRKRTVFNLRPRFSRPDGTLYLVSAIKEEDYYSQVCWLLAHLRVSDRQAFFVRRANAMHWLLMLVLLIDAFAGVLLPHLMDPFIGLMIFVAYQFLFLLLVRRSYGGMLGRDQIIRETMVETEAWTQRRADLYDEVEPYPKIYYLIICIALVFGPLIFL